MTKKIFQQSFFFFGIVLISVDFINVNDITKIYKMLNSEYTKKFKYFTQTRSPSEIALTNQLAYALSDLNLVRVNNQIIKQPQSLQIKSIKKEDFLYVCLSGIPPFQDQFVSLNLPGDCLFYRFAVFEKDLTPEEMRTVETQWETQAKNLEIKINQKSKTKPLVFVYHSFGTYLASTYFSMFPQNRIVGMIDIGGAPIRFTPFTREWTMKYSGIPFSQIQKNIDLFYQKQVEINKSVGMKFYEHKYQLLGVARVFNKGKGFTQIFQLNRQWPNVLKCFIYGRKDTIFPENLLNQKTIYYAFEKKLPKVDQVGLCQAYYQLTGVKLQNIQSKFIFNISQGHHSLHMQKKLTNLVVKIVHEYLEFIEFYLNNHKSKL